MKKLTVKKGATCMACLECVEACSNAYYKESNVFKSCIQIVERKGEPKPMACPQCGKCAEACPEGAITQNAKGVYMINKKKCVGCGKCVEACPAGAVKLGQKLCDKEGCEITYPRMPLPGDQPWGEHMWTHNYRDVNRINCYDAGTAPC